MSVADYIGPTGLANFNLDTVLRRHVAMVIDYCAGDLAWAAEELGVHKSSIRRWCKLWGIEPDPTIHTPPRQRGTMTLRARKWSTHQPEAGIAELDRQLVADMRQAGKRRQFGGDSHSASPNGADGVRVDGQASRPCQEART